MAPILAVNLSRPSAFLAWPQELTEARVGFNEIIETFSEMLPVATDSMSKIYQS